MGKNPSLTSLMIAFLLALAAISLMFTSMSSFLILNNASLDEQYEDYFIELSSSYDSFSDKAGEIGDQGLVTRIFGAGGAIITGTLNVFVIGLSSIGKFFEMIPLIGTVISVLTLAIPGISFILGLLTIITGFYMAMRYVQSARGTNQIT